MTHGGLVLSGAKLKHPHNSQLIEHIFCFHDLVADGTKPCQPSQANTIGRFFYQALNLSLLLPCVRPLFTCSYSQTFLYPTQNRSYLLDGHRIVRTYWTYRWIHRIMRPKFLRLLLLAKKPPLSGKLVPRSQHRRL